MAVRSKNLNLLPLLQALLEENSLMAAADKVGLSQPAMSAALARLREAFNDPLLVRVGRTMQPTPRALELKHQLNDVCSQIELLFDANTFDPASSKADFRIATPSYLSFLLADKWITHLTEIAPGITIDFVDVPIDLPHWLSNGTIDVAIVKPLETWTGLRNKKLFDDQAVVMVSEVHPFYSKSEASLEELSTNQTVEFNFNATYPFISKEKSPTAALAGYQHTAQISSMSQFNAIILATQHPIFVLVPRSLARRLSNIFPLKALEISDNDIGFSTEVMWSNRTEKSPPHKWLRQEIENTLMRI